MSYLLKSWRGSKRIQLIFKSSCEIDEIFCPIVNIGNAHTNNNFLITNIYVIYNEYKNNTIFQSKRFTTIDYIT